ncbi:MAG: efflux RND transporter periplasmic adaptor subunit [Verrucomicrobiota bacterium]|jgi:membrane fusion protein (multidrug efflux system)
MNRIKRSLSALFHGGIFLGAGMAAWALMSTGCEKQSAGFTPPPQVGVEKVATESLQVTTELPGRIDPIRTSEVRARVAGILLKEVYTEGSDVKAGDVLFQIDPAPLQATYDGAQAALAKAQANLIQTQAQADRDAVLIKIHAVSQLDYETAVSGAAQANADVLAAKAALETAGLNLGYATVTAPIAGRIGKALATEGALVGQGEVTELALIQQLDPIYFDFTQSSVDILRLRKQLESGQFRSVEPGTAKITLLLEDGSVYPLEGKLLFSDITVDPTTGMVTLRAEFPNPDALLLPGMFARGRLDQAVDNRAITVSMRAVMHGPDGSASVYVVTPDNKVEVRAIKADTALGNSKWIVTDGLKTGEQVIVEGVQKVQPGMTVVATPYDAGTNAPAADQPNP